MRGKIRKWGHRLALKIPISTALAAGWREGTVVARAVFEGQLIVTPQPDRLALDQLLAGITPDNLHSEQPFGGPFGQEIW